MNINFKNESGYIRIEYIIGVFFLLRLIGITNAPLEIAHNWRQVTGLMVERNFFEIDSTLWFPRVDETNGVSGIIGMEFPLLNYLHYLTSFIFDYQHWYGRLINLIVSSLGIYFFFKLLKERLNQKTAYYSSLFLLGSIWFIYSRKMMPDTFSMSLGFIGLYYAWKHLNESSLKHYILFFLFISLAFLSKISAVMCIVGIPFLFKNIHSNKSRIQLMIGVCSCLLITYLWYFIWNPHLAETYGSWYNSGTTLLNGVSELSGNLPETFKRFYFGSFHSFIAFSVLVFSIGFCFVKKQYKMLLFLLSACLLFGLYMAKSGAIFYIHDYYIIPIVPFFAILIGNFMATLNNRYIAVSIVVLFLFESIANQQHDLFIKDSEKYKLELEKITSKLIDKNDLIAINGNGNPQELYLSHRKGFVLNNEDLNNELKLRSLKSKGCKYLIVNKHNFKDILGHKEIFKNEDYVIYKLED